MDSLNLVLKQNISSKNTHQTINSYLLLAQAAYDNENTDEALIYLRKGQKLFSPDTDINQQLDYLYWNGRCYHILNDYQLALEFYTRFLEDGVGHISNSFKAKTISYIATIYQSLGDYQMAYDYQLKALKVQEVTKDSLGIASTLYYIGSILFYQKNYKQSLVKYKASLEIFEELESKRYIYASLAAIGSSYEYMNILDTALVYNFRSLQLAEELDSKSNIAYSLHNIGSTYMRMSQYNEATNFINRSILLKKETGDKWGLIGSMRTKADLFIRIGEPENAIPSLEEALLIAQEIKSKPRILEIYELFTSAYSELKQYEKSVLYYEKYVALQSDVLNEATLREMGKRKSGYELQKKENEIALLKKENQILEKDMEIESLYRSIWIVAAFFLILLLGVLFSRFRVQKQSNKLLEEKNKEIHFQNSQLELANQLQLDTNKLLEEKNKQIELQNKALEDSNEELKNFAYVASHDLKEPLRMINAYTSLLNRKYAALFDDNAKEFMGYILDAVKRMENLLTDLLSYSRVNTQEKPHGPVNMKDIFDIVVGTLHPRIKAQGAAVQLGRNGLPIINANRTQMIQLLQNLISNAVKFKGAYSPLVIVDCLVDDTNCTFSVKDNGIGISEENKEKVFEMFRRLNTREEYEGTGIGLATCKKIMDRHNGKIWLESEEGKGTTFFFSLPIEALMKIESKESGKVLA